MHNYSSLDVVSSLPLSDKLPWFPVEVLCSCLCVETDIRPSVCSVGVISEESPVAPPVEVPGTDLHVI